ncbi:MAG: helix-turn-helix domain-containing protein [Methylococcales bacterium]
MVTDDLYDLLPKRTAELVQVVGFDAAMALVNQFGGTHLNIPKKARLNHKLCSVIGLVSLEKLCAYYGGTPLEIDLCANIISQQKKLLIMMDVKAGVSNAVVARKFNTTERNVRRIKQKSKEVYYSNVDIFELT